MANETTISNRALQRLGASRITSLEENSPNARACLAAFYHVLDAMIEEHNFSFSFTRVEVAADADAPAFGRARSFSLPADCIAILPPYPEENLNDRDWIVEGRKIYTDDTDPLYLRYKRRPGVDEMTPLFREAFAMKLAEALCEEITQSNTKKQDITNDALLALIKAKRADARSKVSGEPPEDSLITVRA